ncbi:HAD family hydrolase [Bifidobacterium callitrichos]|uniref:HAD family hydrolase n=1 Tax=Bifidobacterium callitrichos DSM 23973 TaxID=1437609 RepID=A0A086ZWG8_9BIFI|nr:HAD family hydrolase [Bifidobacterium callitrichos]KFI50868.1 HAD family hydrolase [Bifidobacterium callitrichos DSM 23973]
MTGRLVFLDIDGTLCDSSKHIPPSAVEAIRTARTNGCHVFIDTGRALPQIGRNILDIGFDGIISSAGARIDINGTLLQDRFLDKTTVTQVADMFDRLGINHMWQSSQGLWASPGYLRLIERIRRDIDPGYGGDQWRSLTAARQEATRSGVPLGEIMPASKCTFHAPPDSTITLDQIRRLVGDRLHIVEGSMGLDAPANGEGMIPGIDKGTGLTTVAAHYGIRVEDTIAFGDSENDLEMIQTAGIGIAMGNATPQLTHVADLTAPHVDDDGIARMFAQLELTH